MSLLVRFGVTFSAFVDPFLSQGGGAPLRLTMSFFHIVCSLNFIQVIHFWQNPRCKARCDFDFFFTKAKKCVIHRMYRWRNPGSQLRYEGEVVFVCVSFTTLGVSSRCEVFKCLWPWPFWLDLNYKISDNKSVHCIVFFFLEKKNTDSELTFIRSVYLTLCFRQWHRLLKTNSESSLIIGSIGTSVAGFSSPPNPNSQCDFC